MREPEKTEVPETAGISSRARFRQILSVLRRHDAARNFSPEKLRSILEDLGPTFIKLGQIMSMRTDMLPPQYCAELTRLRADVTPMPFSDVRAVVESSCGAPLEKLFESFDENPIGSASIAQAHRAQLRDKSAVVVKVQRIGIYDTMARDIALFRRASRLMKLAGGAGDVIDIENVLAELWNAAKEEMDFLVEARNAKEFGERNRSVAFVSCPRIDMDLSTEKVLVMEYIDGYAVNDRKGLEEGGYDLGEIGAKLADNYIKQVIDDGFFHADPHPGNIKVRDGKIVWIDLGMMGRISPHDQKLLGRAIAAVAKHDVGTVMDVVMTMGVFKGRGQVNQARLYADIDRFLSRYGSMELGSMNLGMALEDFLHVARDHQIMMPRGLFMLGRGITTLEGVLSDISPDVNMVEIAAGRISGGILGDFDFKKSTAGAARKTLESGKRTFDIPILLSDIMKMGIRGQAKLNVEIQSSEEVNRTANRITDKLITGILIAAFLVGSSIICTTDMRPTMMGIPALGVLGYAAAIVLGLRLFYSMLKNRRK